MSQPTHPQHHHHPHHQRTLGKSGIQVSALGLGCMGMSYAYGPADDEESLDVLFRYLELGGNFLDSAEIYGPYTNEELLGRFLKEVPREDVVVATKFGFKLVNGKITGVNGRPENAKKVIDESLQRLGLDYVDLYYQHRVDPTVPIEDTVGAMGDLVAAGKVRALGLSEAGVETLHRANAVHPIAALQSELSLWSRDVEEAGIIAACRELGIAFIPYSPLGRGFLTGAIQKIEDLPADDWRRTNPRFQEEALAANLALANGVKALASDRGCTPAQLALAWVLAQGEDIIPIPGTKRVKYLEDNMGALRIHLTEHDLAEIEDLCARTQVIGERYPKAMMGMLNK